ncbi:hypothetical protein BO71DRAFT_333209 [Aspergillus ellipticus CBS 707.79]|uniref:Uncharacterized protein n=1 Tax=Aspergillus ellipticus CBS 707.79 TaxID=1448320 RepID=A0A319EJ67_9EURO|nr:hypothetical protein BO71DRAFT_333209 [Aspergillus ellipticus CBS 707.79]
MSSDSRISRTHLLAPPPVIPAPSFIASSAAAQIITADQEFNTADFVADDEVPGLNASALVTRDALAALNGFLDNLLFNILAAAKSTQLGCIRPAVTEVLKPRLAREMVAAADDELCDYLGGPEDEQIEFRGGQAPGGDFDLIHTWKMTRLRCMVYTRLGDMEEDDEEEYINQDTLDEEDGAPRRLASHVSNITPAAAIFLTSIIEHIGEQALVIAGETARSRLSKKFTDDLESTEMGANRGPMDRLVVEDHDMEKLGLNPTLGRLWRTWRKRLRGVSLSRAMSRESLRHRSSMTLLSGSCKSSATTIDELSPQAQVDPVAVPLPMSEHDVQEIEIPGFLPELDTGEIQTMQAVVAHKVRPHSLMVLTLPSPRSPSSSANSPLTPKIPGAKAFRHARSRSLPNTAPIEKPSPVEQPVERSSPTPSEERRRLETMYEHDEDEEPNSEVKSAANKAGRDAPSESSESAVTAATSPTSFVSVEATTEASNTPVPSTPLTDRDLPETEVLEDHGTSENLKPASVQRPKRKALRSEEGSTPSARTGSEPGAPTGLEGAQGGDSTPPAQPAADLDGDAPLASRSSEDDGVVDKAARPVSTSGESEHSDSSRTRPKSSPLATGSLHRYGRSSPGIATSSSGIERAAVQRLSGRPSTSVASSSYSKSRRSDSFSSSRERRPVTAGSTTSQVSNKLKGLIGRPGESGSIRVRSSSELDRVSTRESGQDPSAGLDELIRSEETIHFTLTPKSMREMELPDSPRWKPQQSNPAGLAGLKGTSPPDDLALSRISIASSKSITGLAGSKPRPIEIPSMNSQQKPSIGSARDTKQSFLKSNSPNTPTTPATGESSPRKPSAMRRFSDATVTKKVTRPANLSISSSTHSGPRLEARSPLTPKGDQTSDLIDFIREGPPTAGAHRIPRTVAPFRDTMDSDEFQDDEPNLPGQDAPSVASTQDSMAKSLTSVGSRTGLLESAGRTNTPSALGREPIKPVAVNASDDIRPPRTRRRVPDPYAIDMDDDDEELEALFEAPKPKREEESLMDFLRNVPPPPEIPASSPPPPIVNSRRGSAGGLSASAMKARLRRNTTSEKAPSAKPSKSSLRQPSENQATVTSNYSVKVGMDRNGTTGAGASGAGATPRRQTDTSALADFLRNTGPPEPPVTKPPPSKKDSGFARLFVRRKKVEV